MTARAVQHEVAFAWSIHHIQNLFVSQKLYPNSISELIRVREYYSDKAHKSLVYKTNMLIHYLMRKKVLRGQADQPVLSLYLH